MSKIGIDIEKAKQILQKGGLAAIPTETVYGLAANALDKEAVLKIFEAKNRPHFDPLIIHTDSAEKVKQWVTEIPAWAQTLANAFWPGPLTLLLPKEKIVPDIVTSGLPNVAVRIPKHELTLNLLRRLDFPLAAPSANPFGYVSPTTAAHVAAQLENKVNYILDGGDCEVGIESTIVGFEEGNICIYRLGGLAVEEIEAVLGKVELKINHSSDPKAPGMLKNHYAPRKPLYIGDVEALSKVYKDKKPGIISYYKSYPIDADIKILSPAKNIHHAAHHLFSALRELDESDCEIILAEKFPDDLLGRAINDRLLRASIR